MNVRRRRKFLLANALVLADEQFSGPAIMKASGDQTLLAFRNTTGTIVTIRTLFGPIGTEESWTTRRGDILDTLSPSGYPWRPARVRVGENLYEAVMSDASTSTQLIGYASQLFHVVTRRAVPLDGLQYTNGLSSRPLPSRAVLSRRFHV